MVVWVAKNETAKCQGALIAPGGDINKRRIAYVLMSMYVFTRASLVDLPGLYNMVTNSHM